MTTDHKCVATEGLLPSVLNAVKKTATIATLGLLCSLVIPPEIKQPVDSGGFYTYVVDGDLIPRPYDMFKKKAIIVVVIDNIEYRGVVERNFDINNIRITVDNINVDYPTAKIFSNVIDVKESKPIIETQLIEVKNDYTNSVEIKFI